MGSSVADAFFLVKLVLLKIVKSARTMPAAERGLEGVKVGVLYLPCQQRNHRLPWLTEKNRDMVCVLEGVDLCDICVTCV